MVESWNRHRAHRDESMPKRGFNPEKIGSIWLVLYLIQVGKKYSHFLTIWITVGSQSMGASDRTSGLYPEIIVACSVSEVANVSSKKMAAVDDPWRVELIAVLHTFRVISLTSWKSWTLAWITRCCHRSPNIYSESIPFRLVKGRQFQILEADAIIAPWNRLPMQTLWYRQLLLRPCWAWDGRNNI